MSVRHLQPMVGKMAMTPPAAGVMQRTDHSDEGDMALLRRMVLGIKMVKVLENR